jgi:hypothetical protein
LSALFTNYADIRPAVISLAGLTDDYVHDGRVIFEIMHDQIPGARAATRPENPAPDRSV